MIEKIKGMFAGMRPEDAAYPIVSLTIMIALVIVFVFAARSLYAQMDTILAINVNEGEGLLRLNTEDLATVSRKLSIPLASAPSGEPSVPETTAQTPASATSSETTKTPATDAPDRASIKIAVYNTTATSGLAARLKTALAAEKFSVTETGNKTPVRETTVIQTKSTLPAPFREIIESIVAKSYTVSSESLPSDSPFDVVILIGAK